MSVANIIAPLLDIVAQIVHKQSFPVLHHKYNVQFDKEPCADFWSGTQPYIYVVKIF